MRRCISVAVVTIAFVVSYESPAEGTPISVDGWVTGDGRLTRDSATGLDWLDLTVTNDKSVQDIVTGGFGNLTDLGFRPATLSEVATLFTDLGVVGDPLVASRT